MRLPRQPRPAGALVRRPRARRQERGGERHPVVLRPRRRPPAAARQLERRRLRPAGAAAAGTAPRRRRRPLLGHGPGSGQRPRAPLQQLHQPLPPASHRPDGPAGDVPVARQRAARRDGQAVRLSRQARHGRLAGLRRLPRRPARRDPPLLRDRRDEHLPAVVPLREDARPPRRGRAIGARSASPATRSAAIGEPHWAEYLAAWPAEEARADEGARAPASPSAGAGGDGAGGASRRRRSRPRRSRSSRRRPRRRPPRRRSTSIPRASARSRRASPGAGWSCGCGRPSRRR